jgi:Fungal specific transcription factor domain
MPISDLPWPNLSAPEPVAQITCEDNDSSSSPETALSIFHSPAPAPDPDIPSTDLPYFNFFLAEMSNVLPYVNIFPATVSSVFSTSIHHPALRHSVLSVSALIADKKSDKGRERALEHLQKSLKLLQNSLSAVEVDEGVAISIFLLAYFNVASGEHSTARKHLRGLCMVLDQLQQNHLVKNGGILSPNAITPLTMLVWRMAIRMDFIMAITYGRRPVFPMYFVL